MEKPGNILNGEQRDIGENEKKDVEVTIDEELKFHHQTPLAGTKSFKIVGTLENGP